MEYFGMNFKNDSKEDLQKLINSDIFLMLEISQIFANDLIKKCEFFGLIEEIKRIQFITINPNNSNILN